MTAFIGGISNYRYVVGGDLHIKPVTPVKEVKLQALPFFVKSRINANALGIGLNPSETQHGGHPGSTVCRRMRTSDKNGSDICLIFSFKINFRRLQEIVVCPVQFADVSGNHGVGTGTET